MMVSDTEMTVETHPNPHVVTWHVRKRLTDQSIMMFESKNWLSLRQADDQNWFGTIFRFFSRIQKFYKEERNEEQRLAPLIRALFEIRGVERVTIYQYGISVAKAQLFTWDEISPRVEEILEVHLTVFH